MKILCSNDLAMHYRSLQFAQRNALVIGMMACFRFAQTGRNALIPGNEMWPLVTQVLGEAGLLDEVYPKPAGEYAVYGAAYAPEGRAVEQLRVSVCLGSLKKSLIVTGNRQFNAIGLMSRPKPFIRMPIVPETAFGGDGFADNPRGKGYGETGDADGATVWPLPNIEYEYGRIASRGERIAPAGFWGFDIASPPRQQYLGTCDDHWLKHDWPHLPADTRSELFMSAAPDQRLRTGYFSGNESFEIANMHPVRPTQRGALPGLRARCFVNQKTSTGDLLSEVTAHAETVCLFPELDCGVVVYRAIFHCADDEASDVKHIKAVWETLNEVPLPFEHYRAEFEREIGTVNAEAASAQPLAGTGEIQAEQATAEAQPPGNAAVNTDTEASATVDVERDAQFAGIHAMAEQLDAEMRALMRQHNVSDVDLEKFMPKPEPVGPAPTFEELQRQGDQLGDELRSLMEKYNLTDEDVKKFIPEPEQEDTPSFAAMGKMMAELSAETRALMQKYNLTEEDLKRTLPPEVVESLGEGSLLEPPDVDFAALDMRQPPPAPESELRSGAVPPARAAAEDAAAAALTREDVAARHATRGSFAGYDLTGLDLSELDLTGADFSGATLDRVSFAKSRLDDAVFARALLRGADFSEATLERARLDGASAEGSTFAKANLQAAQLVGGDFSSSDFSEACLAKTELDRAIFDKARLPGVNAASCRAQQTSFTECDLSGANFSNATLQSASFNESRLAQSRFCGALCEHAEFYGAEGHQADFTGADLRKSRADEKTCFDEADFASAQIAHACWDGTQLRKASFESARLDHADFTRVQARGAQFRLASAKGTRFEHADLSGAEMSAINMFGGSLRKANLSGTRMQDANLYGVDFGGTQPTFASVERANIDCTILQYRPPVI
ncbi:DUF2169 domain-containing protein [Paraburkholderia sp. J10-1]|uniref:DUF2169 family type VI secretion system accessory protein n=1 Tax=Paraburkholderia sp. J10-1 TaxID=2805430 RepID=UPI002AB710CF|nr:DUF2169 domain-containing protein [Paraburkholderia sp. J10-1]